MRKIRYGERAYVNKGDIFILVIGTREVPAVYTSGGLCKECPLWEEVLGGKRCASWVRSCKLELNENHIIQIEDTVE